MRRSLKKYSKFVWVFGLPLLAAGTAFSAPAAAQVIPGHYIVVLKAGAGAAEVANTHAVNPHHSYAHALNGFAAEVSEGRLRALHNDPRVEMIEQDVLLYATGQVVPSGVQRIGATLSPAAKIDGLDERVNVDIAILDTGIDLTHPDLNVYRAVSFSPSNTTGNDGHGHGTHVAGTAAALDNGIGVVGVAPGSRLWAVKVLDDSGSGSLSAILSGIDYVTQNASQIEVVNMSLAGQGTSASLRQAIQNSVAKGVVYVVAAGNSNAEIYGNDGTFGTADDYFPASYPEVMTISALADSDGKAGGTGLATSYGPDDTIASFSDYSLSVVAGNPVTSPGRAIDLAAPGVNIYSTYKGGAYATMSGTSMASPHVAGAVALYIAQNGRANDAAGVARIRQALINSAEPQTHWGPANTNPGKDFDIYPEGLVNVAGIGRTTPPNNPPSVVINTPATGSSFPYGTTINFSGNASDTEDGDLTSKLIWTSSISGTIGSGGNFAKSLASGTHTITAKVTDSAGNTASSSVTITVTAPANNPPKVTINNPITGSSFPYGATLTFSGSASDAEDGDLTSKLTWTSSINGAIGTGGNFTKSLANGIHTITARVTDSGGSTGTASVTITVAAPTSNNPPKVTINSPATGSSFYYGTVISFSGTASDTEDGNLSSKLIWTSSINGTIGTGGNVTALLSSGTHLITAQVTDSAGNTASVSVTITVNSLTSPVPRVTISFPVTGSTSSYATAIIFFANAFDFEEGDLTSRLIWTSSIDGQIGTGGILYRTLSAGTHTITASATDSTGLVGRASVTLYVTR